jgi:membrane-anchored glycerophosphoryl diester phosphodiesterase (GDPDase)
MWSLPAVDQTSKGVAQVEETKKLDIGRVFSDAFSMMRRRSLALIGIFAIFFILQILISVPFAGVVGAMGASMSAAAGGEIFASGLGAGMIAAIVIFYLVYFFLTYAWFCASLSKATPLYNPDMGSALGAGARGGLTMLGVLIVLLAAYIPVFLLFGAMAAAGEALAALAGLLLLPAIIYLGCRLSMVMPVAAIDRVSNPLTVIRESWAMTKGNVLRILVVLIVLFVMIILLFAPLFGVMVGMEGFADGATPDPSAIGGSILMLILAVFLLYIGMVIIYSTIVASTHAQLTASETDDLGETFA